MLLVITDHWNAIRGTAQRFERENATAAWRAVESPVDVVVGRTGLAWGRGVHARQPGESPTKKEGDGKAPAGVFRLSAVFGQSAAAPARLAMPYRTLADQVECVDDVRSAHYNELVVRAKVASADWNSSERMWEEPLYKWGIVVDHNAGNPGSHAEPSAGSCIFLHIWKGPASGTAGCTAMAESNLLDTITWLDARRKPVLVQLPRSEYVRLRTGWQLP